MSLLVCLFLEYKTFVKVAEQLCGQEIMSVVTDEFAEKMCVSCLYQSVIVNLLLFSYGIAARLDTCYFLPVTCR